MNGTLAEKVFSVTRDDLLFDYASNFGDVFKFSAFSTDEPNARTGVREQQALGYDFQNEYSPIIEISPISSEALSNTDLSVDDLTIHISIEDVGLTIRKPVQSILMAEASAPERVSISLRKFKELSFHRGFEVRCIITRTKSVPENKNVVWHKSQIIHESNFIVKASVEEALFEIVWTQFQRVDENRDVLYFIEWMSHDVSTERDSKCFQVKANQRLRDQFKRLENNSHFGEFSIRMIAYQILRELLIQTLRYAKIDANIEPESDSLHQKFEGFLKKHGAEFNHLATRYQSGDSLDQLAVSSEITTLLQRISRIGSTLDGIKFGGYR